MLCTLLGRTTSSCTATYVLPRGRIVTDGLIESRRVYELAISGGTGLYANARGTLVVTIIGVHPRRHLLVFRLVDFSASPQAASSPLKPPTVRPAR